MKRHLVTGTFGALAGGLVAALVQVGDVGREGDVEQLVRRVVIGAGAWTVGAIALRWAAERSSGRPWAWTVLSLALALAMTVALALAGKLVLGFADRFALVQALALAGPCGLGVWLGGVLTRRSG